MQRMITIKDEEIYINLCSIKAMRPETRTINAHKIKHEQSEEPMTIIDLGGEGSYFIKEPSFRELLTKAEAAHHNR